MFGSLGAPEILLIFIVALLVFGPRRLPEIGRKIGGIVRELRRSTGDFRSTVEREMGLDPASTGVEEIQRARRDLLSAVSDPLRDAAGAVRDVREAIILPPGRVAEEAPAGSVPGPAPGRTTSPVTEPQAPASGTVTPPEGPAPPSEAPSLAPGEPKE